MFLCVMQSLTALEMALKRPASLMKNAIGKPIPEKLIHRRVLTNKARRLSEKNEALE